MIDSIHIISSIEHIMGMKKKFSIELKLKVPVKSMLVLHEHIYSANEQKSSSLETSDVAGLD